LVLDGTLEQWKQWKIHMDFGTWKVTIEASFVQTWERREMHTKF
jgi:hypothetical protein